MHSTSIKVQTHEAGVSNTNATQMLARRFRFVVENKPHTKFHLQFLIFYDVICCWKTEQ